MSPIIQLSLDDYTRLLWQANRNPLLTDKFCLITRDQAKTIRLAEGWEESLNIQDLDQDEIDQLKSLNIIRGDINIGDYFKLYKLSDWLTMHLIDQQKKLQLQQQTQELIIKEQRVKEAIFTLSNTLKLEYKVAFNLVHNYALKGLMPDIAKQLNIQDLVNFKLPTII